MEWHTTSTLLQQLGDFDNGPAWQRLVDRFQRPVVAFARKVGLAEADAEDVAQETLSAFAQGYRAGKYDPGKGRLSHWLFGIAYRQVLSARRRSARQAAGAASPNATSFWENIPAQPQASAVWDHEWEQALLRECLERIRLEFEGVTVQAFDLVMRHQRSPDQAAAELDVPIKTVYNAKHRVLKRIRQLRGELEQI